MLSAKRKGQLWTAGPPDLAALVEVMARYGSEIVRPG
jgi:hypothetical protein